MYNYKKCVDRLIKWANGEEPYPVSATIFPTERCNLNCRMCGGAITRQDNDYTNEVQKEDWIKFVGSSLSAGVLNWRITGGGEPLMRKDVTYRIIKMIKTKEDTSCLLGTNATLIDSKDARFIVETGLDVIEISVDALEDGVHDYIRGKKGCFRRVEGAVRLIASYKKKLSTHKPLIRLHTLLNSFNYNKFQEFIKKWATLGVGGVMIHPLCIYPETEKMVSKIVPSRDQIKEFQNSFESLNETATLCQINVNASELRGLHTQLTHNNDKSFNVLKTTEEMSQKNRFVNLPCLLLWCHILVEVWGDASFCCSLGKGLSKGNSENNIKRKSLKEIWFSNYFSSVREGLLTGRLEVAHAGCKNCGETDVNATLRRMLIEAMRG